LSSHAGSEEAVELGVSVKLAPGVRVRATRRGMRASLGSSAERRSTLEPPQPAVARLNGQEPAADKTPSIQDVLEAERLLTTRHLVDFPVSQPALARAPQPLDVDRVEQQFLPQAMAKVGWLNRARRRAAREEARLAAIAFADEQYATAREEAERLQSEYYSYWNALISHDRDTVVEAVDDAFAEAASESTCVDAGSDPFCGRYVSCVVTFGQPDVVPDHLVATTPTGRPELRQRDTLDVNNLYVDAMASTVLATVREALAVAPATDEVRMVVVRNEPPVATSPNGGMRVIYAGAFLRRDMETVDWQTVDLEAELLRALGAELVREGDDQTVVPLDEDAHRRMFAVLHAFSGPEDHGSG